MLLLEDHDDSRELLVRALRGAGGRGRAAFGAAGEAFAALEQVRPTAMVADIGLPGEDGYSFIRRVRAHSIPSNPERFRRCGHALIRQCRIGAEALAVGFQQHLPKPSIPSA